MNWIILVYVPVLTSSQRTSLTKCRQFSRQMDLRLLKRYGGILITLNSSSILPWLNNMFILIQILGYNVKVLGCYLWRSIWLPAASVWFVSVITHLTLLLHPAPAHLSFHPLVLMFWVSPDTFLIGRRWRLCLRSALRTRTARQPSGLWTWRTETAV